MAKITYKGKEHDVKIKRSMIISLEENGFPAARLESAGDEAPMRLLATCIKLALNLDDDPQDILDNYPDLPSFVTAGKAILDDFRGLLAHPTQATKKVAKRKR